MKKKLNILMVDDHPFIIEGYKNILTTHTESCFNLNITTATSGNEVEALFQFKNRKISYHLALIDINIPKSDGGLVNSGKDAAMLVQLHYPNAKIIILTMHDEDARLREILSQINPEGFLVKSDLSSESLTKAFDDIMAGHTSYSTTVNNHIRKTHQNTFNLDEKNLKILYYLSRGARTKNLPQYIGLSLSAIEKRKNQMKILFDIKSSGDEALITEARKKGFV